MYVYIWNATSIFPYLKQELKITTMVLMLQMLLMFQLNHSVNMKYLVLAIYKWTKIDLFHLNRFLKSVPRKI